MPQSWQLHVLHKDLNRDILCVSRHRQSLCTSLNMNGTLQYLIQETKMGLRSCGSCYGLRECLPGSGVGVAARLQGKTHIFKAKLVGHARQHSTALPKILFVTVCGTRAQGRSLLKLTHLHRRPQIYSVHGMHPTCTYVHMHSHKKYTQKMHIHLTQSVWQHRVSTPHVGLCKNK